MKSIGYLFFAAALYSYTALAQSTGQNFVKKTVPVSPVTTETALNALSASFKVEGINYLDGLGRPLQDVLVKGSPGSRDIIQPYVYDQYGRQSMTFLPYTDATASGTYRSAFITPLTDFYTNQTMVGKTAYPYSEAVFDNSPLNVLNETSAPDADWQLGNGHTSKMELSYNPNPNDDAILLWELQTNGDYATNNYYYPQNTLYTKKITDPNGNYSIVYTDRKGKTVCMKQFLETRYFNGNPYPYYLVTYPVYDDFGQLVLVIPPKAMELMDASQNYSVNGLAEDLVYRYVYDQRHRLIEKKVPGTGWQYIVYNQLNQPVLFRDANLTAQNKWSFIKYDVLGRPILSGLMNASGLTAYQSRALAQAAFDASQPAFGESEIYEDANNPFGYTNSALPNQNLEILTVNYYDDYDFNNDGTADHTFNTNPVPCVVFNIANLASIHNKMQTSVTSGTSMNGSLNAAIGMASGLMATRLNYCLSQLNTLQPVMESNAAKSYSLTLADNESLLGSLNTSLQGQTTNLIKTIVDTIAACRRADPKNSTDFTNRLAEIQTSAQAISNKTSTSLPLLATVISGCQPYINTPATRRRGYLTGSKVKVLDATNPVQWENTVVFYDEDGQAIQSQSNDHLGGTDLINLVYDFAGNVIHSQQVHTLSGQPTIQVLNHMSFDKMGRLLRVDQKNNADMPVVLSTYSYNELSQVIDKKVHSLTNATSFLQSMDFRYNVQGWLTSINNISLASDMSTNPTSGTNDDLDDLWGMELSYNATTLGGAAQYNGNVSEKKWRSVDYVKRSYKYDYDKLDRLKSSSYAEFSSFTGWSGNVGAYDEKDITYDANGNIKTLKRYGFQTSTSGFGLIDQLTYQYSGNLLGAVTDASGNHGMADFKDNGSSAASGEYSYDGNGNLTANANKGISSISYNHLNLPVQIMFSNGNKIEYLYDAVGTRLRKKTTQGSTVTQKNYAGIFEYNSVGQLESMHTSEGRCVTTGALPAFRYEYQYMDNTGNTMLAFSDMDLNNSINPSTEVIQQNHYYPFGMRMEGTNAPFVGVENKYKFSGKELDDELGLNEYDFGARMYDPAIGRWGCIDPMADAAPHWTPFRYGFNNPVNITDPTGMLEVSDQVGGGLDYSTAGTYTGTPRYVWKEVNGKMVGDWEGGSSDVKKGKKEEVAKGVEKPQEAKGRSGSGNTNSATAGTGATTYVAGGSMNGMGNGGPAINYATEGTESIGGYQGPGFDPWMLAKNGTYYYPDKVPFGEKMEVLASWSTEVITGIFGGAIVSGLKNLSTPMIEQTLLRFGCFTEGTLVWTEKGLLPIEKVKEGEIVYTYDLKKKKIIKSEVTLSYKREINRLIKLEFNNEIIYTTPEHPFFVNEIWIEASKLNVGDSLFSNNKNLYKIDKIKNIDTVVIVYNFTVDKTHNYYVGNNKILVHNNNPCADIFNRWINHTVYNQVRNKFGKIGVDKFIKAMQKGFVSASGENGIKAIAGKGIKIGQKYYKYEIKIKGIFGDWRIYGNMDKNGNLIFDYFGKGVH